MLNLLFSFFRTGILILLFISHLAIAEPVITDISGDISTDSYLTINGSMFTTTSNKKPLFWWKADFGTAPSPLGRKTSWDGVFHGNLSTNIVAAGSHQSYSWDHGKSEAAALGQINFNSDKLYVYRKLYENFDITRDFAIRTRVNLTSGTLHQGDVITGSSSGATATIQSFKQESASGRTHSIYYKNKTGTINNAVPLDFTPGEIMTSGTGAQMTNKETAGVVRTFNLKTIRLWAALGINNNVYIGTQGIEPDPAFRITPEHTDATISRKSFTTPLYQIPHTWNIEQLEYKSSTINVKDGVFRFFQNGILGVDTGIITHTSAFPDKYSILYQTQVSNGAQPGSQSYYDELYINDSWNRVIICKGSTLNKCGRYSEIQIPTNWSDTQITVKLNLGELNPESSLYLYVFDKNGKANTSGFPLCKKCPLPLTIQ